MNSKPIYRLTPKSLYFDKPLLLLIGLLLAFGIFILYSASGENVQMLIKQSCRLGLAFIVMCVCTFIPPHKYRLWGPYIYLVALCLLFGVFLVGKIGKGAQRWLDLGLFRFQPSELMKIAVPLMTAWYFEKKPFPMSMKHFIIGCSIIFIPAALIIKQPDLGTAILVVASGGVVIFVAGLSMQFIVSLMATTCLAAPLLWYKLHDYQKQRIITFLNPENDPLGNGYHIIQSKIAIGSGGLSGKGWLNGSQSHLNFLPEHATDFIFAVCGEEFGFIGCTILILLILGITMRGLYIAINAQTSFSRLLASSLILIFFISAFVNIGMVMGILPVVGIPLPMISYGGTAMVTFMASFGMLMSISTHRILFDKASHY